MARNNETMIHEVRRWKDRLSTIDNIPKNPRHQYKNENNVYERMTVYVKSWVEGMFFKYTAPDGDLASKNDDEKTKEEMEFFPATEYITPLHKDWWDVALYGGNLKTKELPHINVVKVKSEDTRKKIRSDTKDEVVSYFMPLYRTLKESFDKRRWYEWIFNHRRYTAERDALEVIGNIMRTMGEMTPADLQDAYNKHLVSVSSERVADANVAEFDLRKEQEAKEIENAMQNNKGDKEVNKEINPQPAPKPVETDIENAEKIYKDNQNKEYLDEICTEMNKVLVSTSSLNESALNKSVPEHIIEPMRPIAKKMCQDYDKAQKEGTLDSVMTNLIEDASKKLFEAAFKGLAAKHPEIENWASSGLPIFDMKTLKDHIAAAQKCTDIMLKGLTPVGFNGKKYADFAKGAYLYKKTEEVTEFLKETLKDQYTEKDINRAIRIAKNEFGVMYYNDRRIMPQLYEIGYHPNSNLVKLEEEGKRIKNVNNVFLNADKNNETIVDQSSRIVFNENYTRWKEAYSLQSKLNKREITKEAFKTQWDKLEEKWKTNDKILKEAHQDFDPETLENVLETRLVEARNKQQLKLATNANNTNKVPPIKPSEVPANNGAKLDK